MRDFDAWLENMRDCINSYQFYVDFNKVYDNVGRIKTELNILNSLIGEENIEEKFRELLERYPETLKCIPILLAKRENEIYAQDADGAFIYRFDGMNHTLDEYISFMKKTGLLDLISRHIVRDLVDYVTGVETGLDSNGRKNRGGHQMEDLVENYIKHTGAQYHKEMYLADVEKEWGVDLSAISAKGTSSKRWNFVVKTESMIYLIETNFYAGGGSKLNETSRSYKMIAKEASKIDDVCFVWVTDGGGWRSARRNLKETFDAMDTIYNISELESWALDKLFNGDNGEHS